MQCKIITLILDVLQDSNLHQLTEDSQDYIYSVAVFVWIIRKKKYEADTKAPYIQI